MSRGADHADESDSGSDEEDESLSVASEGSSESDDVEARSKLGLGYVGSTASTNWRPERTDRGGLSTVDERLQNSLMKLPFLSVLYHPKRVIYHFVKMCPKLHLLI